MTRHVLVPLDGSEHGFGGLEYALASFPEASLTALYVVDPTYDHAGAGDPTETPTERAEERGRGVLDRAVDRAEDVGRSIDATLGWGNPHREILELAADDDVDHVVMGTHGESPITRPFLGHVSEAVVRRAPVTTTVVPETAASIRERDLPGRILVALDGSEQAEAALAYALETFPDAAHTAFYVLAATFDRPHESIRGTYLEEVLADLEARGEEVLASARSIAEDRDATIETDTAIGTPASEIVEYAAANDVDQIVLGAHGRSLGARLITGSTAERVARRTTRTATLVRGAPTDV